MADRYRTKSHKRSKEDKVHRKTKYDKHAEESKTPPLPNLHATSIKELLKEREILRKKLELTEKQTDKYSKSKTRSSSDSNKRKYSKDEHSRNTKVVSKSNSTKESVRNKSPEIPCENIQLDSEDEENIIEERRKQRKQLLEKLITNDAPKVNKDSEHKTNDVTSVKSDEDNNLSPKLEKNTTDMFSELDNFIPESLKEKKVTNKKEELQLTDNWDDPEGYYKINIGEVVNNKYTIKDVLGQGVFANVVSAQDNKSNNTVAIKIIRNNELMYKTGLKEISILKEIAKADPDNKYHCVNFFDNFVYKNHLCIVLEPLYMDLRSVLKKYGKNHGIHLKAIMSYSRQIFLALRLLKKLNIIHADIKPDNILVNDKKNILKICDFGSACKIDENEPTPYLVSRFYRAPEIILGLPYKFGVDLWSAGCTVFEMATGKILFTGGSNNKMLKCFMDLKGRIPNKLIRKGKFKDQHFNYNYVFLLHKKDMYNGREGRLEIPNINIVRDITSELKETCDNRTEIEERKIMQLKDLLDKMLTLDPDLRISITDCLKHPFIQEELKP